VPSLSTSGKAWFALALSEVFLGKQCWPEAHQALVTTTTTTTITSRCNPPPHCIDLLLFQHIVHTLNQLFGQ